MTPQKIRSILLSLAILAAGCAAEDGGNDNHDQADEGGPGQAADLITTCAALHSAGPGAAKTPIELTEKREEGKTTWGNLDNVDAQLGVAVQAGISDAKPDYVVVLFTDVNTNVATNAEGNLGTDVGQTVDHVDFSITQTKNGADETVLMRCCRNATGECAPLTAL